MAFRRFSTVTQAALSYDLVDLDMVKEELAVAPDDATLDNKLSRIIAQVSRAAASYCNRVFAVETLTDIFRSDGGGSYRGPETLQLERYPVAYALTVTAVDAVAGDTVLTMLDVSGIAEQMPAVAAGIPDGTVVSEIAADPDPRTVTLSMPLSADIPAGTSVMFGLAVVQDPFGAPTTLFPEVDFTIDPGSAQLWRLTSSGYRTRWQLTPLKVTYTAGYVEIPEDLQAAALRWATLRWQAQGRDPSLRSIDIPGVMTEAYWVDPNAPGMPSEIEYMLQFYRELMVG